MSTIEFQQLSVFTAPDHGFNDAIKALGNSASVALVQTLPTAEECRQLSQRQPDTTLVFISPLKKQANHFSIAWFKSGHQIQRCGHGTLAAAYCLQSDASSVVFQSTTEKLLVTQTQHYASLHLVPETLADTNQIPTIKAKRSMTSNAEDGYMIVELNNQKAVKDFTFKNNFLSALGARALIICSVADNTNIDIIFRYFAPQYGSPEDQATGSAASCLWPFWHAQLKKDCLHCYQASAQGGYFSITESDANIVVSGYITEK